MQHMKQHWSEEMEAIKKIVSSGEEKVLSYHVLEMLEERGMGIVDLALVINSGEIILGLDQNDDCPQVYIKNEPGMHRLVLGKSSKGENVVVAIEIDYKDGGLVVEKIITIYSLDAELQDDHRKSRKLQIRQFLASLIGLNHEIHDDQYRDEQGRRVYFAEDGTPYVVGKDGRVLTRFKGYKNWMPYANRKTS